MKNKVYYVYILASKRNGTLYTGVTNDLIRRVMEHKEKITKGFTSKYGVDKLVYYESCSDVREAIKKESNIKAWKRKWKLELIEDENKEWKDLFYELINEDDINDLKEYIHERGKGYREL